MMELRLDKNSDLMFKDGDIAFISNYSEVIAQNIKVRLQTVKGEWFLDRDMGIPYFDILGFSISPQTLSHIFRAAIEEIDGVEKVDEINVSFDNRHRTAKVIFSALLEDGSSLKSNETLELPNV